ncbi:DUF2007 domain-containing protein [Hoeflea sp. YIM 152468]|uniref:putative signal transducing protein n=1 Tax=Hoeflea sp. YIM 152468 TaxID=3031759 RepID=UPI0023DB0BE2|nr:DUF2007 domain-containing protein [Hoeflea sp. YIM 152468]MDF1606621.1 DUF2007 domain-containing protein [Hoeflea sp. YIM 152468]
MHDLIHTNDPVLISFVESLMRDAGIGCLVADSGMSILEGSVGVIPRRILVDPDRASQARRIVSDAGLEQELRPWIARDA